MPSTSYIIGLGSNRRHGRHGRPERILRAAAAAIVAEGPQLVARAKTMRTPALGPAGRDFANSAIQVTSDCTPLEMLKLLKAIERDFGRRPSRRWGARVLDLDILAWSGGAFVTRSLAIPHRALLQRDFALVPAAALAPLWRHADGFTLRQHEARRRKPQPVDRGARAQ